MPTDTGQQSQDPRKLQAQAITLLEAGKYPQATALAERALAIRQQVLGSDGLDVAESLTTLGQLYFKTGNYAAAESAYRRALVIREHSGSATSRETATLLMNLGGLYGTLGDNKNAEPLYERALAICQQTLGEQHTDTARALNGLANLYSATERFEQAESLYLRALAIREHVLGPEHSDTGIVLNGLANVYRATAAYGRALPLYQRAISAYVRSLGPEHLDVALMLGNLGTLYMDTGDFVRAEALFSRGLAIQEKQLPPEHPEIAKSLAYLALLYAQTGVHARAESLYLHALEILEAQPSTQFELPWVLNGICDLYVSMGRFAQAEAMCQRGLQITANVLNLDSSFAASILGNLGRIHAETGDYQRAQPLLRRAIAVFAATRGPDHWHTAQAVSYLADFYRDTGDYAQALLLYQRSANSYEKSPGTEHEFFAKALDDASLMYWARGDIPSALSLLQRAQRVQIANLERILVGGSESRKRRYLDAAAEATSLEISLSLALPDPTAAELGLTRVLQYKGRVLDAMSDSVARLRRSAEPGDRVLLQELAEVANELSVLTYQDPGNVSITRYRARTTQLANRQETLEAQLATRSAEYRAQLSPVTLTKVRKAIPADAALIEWFRYTPVDPKRGAAKTWRGEPRYVAYVLRRSGAPVAVDMGPARVVEALVRDYRAALSAPTRGDAAERAAALSRQLVAPLRRHLERIEHLLISPDGALNLLPFAALTNEHGEYLAQRLEVSYLTSGRDLLRIGAGGNSRGSPVLFADPDYGNLLAGNSATAPQVRSADLDRSGLRFRRLPNTALEARDLQSLLKLGSSHVLLGGEANENALKRVHSPSILHIASHGFFLRDQQLNDAIPRRLRSASPVVPAGENPLLRSGIALAGANQRRWGEDADGILTALEVAQLDLRGTQLVVLSACDSGLGEVQNGEGIYGLRRALTLAGAQTQVASLWRVSDRATRSLVVNYYQRLLQGEGRSAALRQAQLAMLSDPQLAHPYYWASFVTIGDWTQLAGLAASRPE